MACNAGPDIIEDGLVLCLDAANINSYPRTGSVLYDLAGTNNGALENMEDADWKSNYFELGGTDEAISVVNIQERQINEARTLCVWFRGSYQPNDYNVIAGQWTVNQQNFGVWIKNREQIDFFIGGNHYIDGSVSLNGQWQFAAVTINSSNQYNTYINKDKTVSGTQNFNETGCNEFMIGAREQGYSGTSRDRYFIGGIGPICLYNRALTGDEVRQNYEATVGRFV